MLNTLKNAWKIPDLKRKILFTFLIILIFRVGSAVIVPFVDAAAMKSIYSGNAATDAVNVFSSLAMLSGGGFSQASIFSLGIQPYINASIIIQLLTVALPPLERLSKEGEAGRKTINKITRFVTVGLAALIGTTFFITLYNHRANSGVTVLEYANAKSGSFWFAAIVIIFCFMAGAMLIMWLGEQIDEKGIGNGISMILFANILSGIPSAARTLWYYFYDLGIKQVSVNSGAAMKYIILVPIAIIMFLATIIFIVFISDAERKIPVQYAKRVVGRKMYGGQSSFIPIKVNMSGVMPVILAMTMISVPGIIFGFTNQGSEPTNVVAKFIFKIFQNTHPFYMVLYAFLIIAFAFFYVTMQYNPVEMANDLRKNSGAIPGYRPGKPTSDYIKRVLNKITLVGALFLGVIAIVPIIFGGASGMNIQLGGTSIMIVVSVALETTQQMESQMMMRHYKGFLE